MRGRVDRWNEHGKREIGLTRPDGSSLPATYKRALSSRILAEAVGRDIEAWGTIRRNIVGQVVGMSIDGFAVIEPGDPISISSLAGVYQAPAGEPVVTLQDWLNERHAAD